MFTFTDWKKDEFTRPPNWQTDVWNLSNISENNGYKNEDFIVWMRTAALPTFRKLYRRINQTNPIFSSGLPEGTYTITVSYSQYSTHFDTFLFYRKEFFFLCHNNCNSPNKGWLKLGLWIEVEGFVLILPSYH